MAIPSPCTDSSTYQMILSDSSWMINQGNMKFGNGCKYNNLYLHMVINMDGIVNIAESLDSNLWHGRLGHMSQVGLGRLLAIGYIRKLQSKKDFYEYCRYGKKTRSPHSLHYETIRQPLELVQKYICELRQGDWRNTNKRDA